MPAPSPLLKASAFIARWTLALLLFAWFLFGAAWGVLHLAIVPRIGEFRPQLEATASRVLGVPVRIESISAYSTGMLPAFELTNVRLLDGQGRDALHLPRVLVSVSPRSLLALKFDQLYIDRPTLTVRRAADGRITVAGLDMASSGNKADAGVLDRIFSQPEFAIRHGAVVWTDDQRGLPPLALQDVDLLMRNVSRRHELRFDATPPAEWGDRFGIVARFEQPFLSMDNGRWQEWSGQAYAAFDRIDVSALKRHADIGIDVQQGRGALRAWVDIRRGRVTSATADVALADVGLRLEPSLQPLQMASLSGRLTGKFVPGTLEFSTEDLAFDTADGLRWPGGNVHWLQTEGDAARPTRGEFTADRLDLAALTQIASRLPLGDQAHAELAHYAPGGLVERVKASWQGHAGGIDKYEVQGRVRRLRVASQPGATAARAGAPVEIGMPGITGATVDFAFTETGGKASLVVDNGSIEFPGVFEQPLVPFAHLSGDLTWQTDGKGKVQVELAKTRFGNADAEGELQLRWQTSDPARSRSGARFPGVLDLQGSLSRADGTRVFRYLPLVLHQDVRNYVRDAVQAGGSNNVRFKVKGDLHDMPFVNPKQGEFMIGADIRNGTFAYVPRRIQTPGSPPWPVLAQLSGELVFDRKSLFIKGARGSIAGLPALHITKADASIADLMQGSTLAVGAELRGALADMLGAVNGSPLAELGGNALQRANATGNAELRLKLNVPLEVPDKTTVQGSVVLAGNDLQLAPEAPRVARARGTVTFSETGFAVNGLQARVLGGDMRLDGGTVPAPPAAMGAAALRAAPAVSMRATGQVSSTTYSNVCLFS